jgi:hypothetical protein
MNAAANQNASLLGRTIRWTFSDGQMAGKTFDHTFNSDGSVVWRSVDGDTHGKLTAEKISAVAPIDDHVTVVSYRSSAGYTLTVVLDFRVMQLVGFASNSEMWSQQTGTFAVLPAAA